MSSGEPRSTSDAAPAMDHAGSNAAPAGPLFAFTPSRPGVGAAPSPAGGATQASCHVDWWDRQLNLKDRRHSAGQPATATRAQSDLISTVTSFLVVCSGT